MCVYITVCVCARMAHSGEVEVGLFAVSPEEDGGFRMRSGDGLAIHQ